MSEILLNWINNEVKLSSSINNLDEDFSNGYLFAELLHKFKQIPNLSDYRNQANPSAVTQNFNQLVKAFQDLEVRYDNKKIKEIMECKKGTAAQFLYQIKMKLAKKEINFDSLFMKNTSSLQKMYQTMYYPNLNAKYLKDHMNRDSSEGGNRIHKPLRLPELHKRIGNEIIKEQEYFQTLKDQRKKRIYTAEVNNHLKLNETERSGLNGWKENIKRMNNFDKKRDEEELKQTIYYRRSVLNNFNQSEVENKVQIESFDRNLSKLGLDITAVDPKIKKHAQMDPDILMQRIRDKMEMDKEAKKERDRRKRKMGGQQGIAPAEMEKSKSMLSAEEKFLSTGMTARDKRTEYEEWRKLHERETQKREKQVENERLAYEQRKLKELEVYKSSEEFDPENFFKLLNKENLQYRVKDLQMRKGKFNRDSKIILPMVEQIIGLTEEAYKYQTENNVDLVDVKEWRKWMEMFINNESINKEVIYFEDKTEDINQMDESIYITSEYEEDELADYIHFIGRWKEGLDEFSQLFGSQLQMKEIIVEELNKGSTKSFNNKVELYEPTENDIENLTIPKTNAKNFNLGEIIEIVVEIKHPNEQTPERESILSYIPFKISLLGHLFAGKKIQAKMLADSYPQLKIYNLDEMLKKAVETQDRLETPIEAHPKFKSFKKAQLEAMMKEKAQEEENFRELGNIIQPYLNNRNENPSDDVLIDLFLYNIKVDFPERSQKEIVEEIVNRTTRKRQIIEELTKIKEEQIKKPKAKLKEENLLNAELNKLTLGAYKGFILVDFPKTEQQIKKLERILTGYVPEYECPKSQKNILTDKLYSLVEKNYYPPSKSGLRPSGLDVVIEIDVPTPECLRRALGRRIDPNTGNVYHIEDNPPPQNDHKLNDRLQIIPEPTEEEIRSVNLSQDFSFVKLREFYNCLGNDKYKLNCLNILNGNNSKSQVNADIQTSYMEKLIHIMEEKEQNMVVEYSQANDNAITNELQLLDEEDSNKFTRRLSEARKRLSLQSSDNIYHTWIEFCDHYSTEMKIVLKQIRKQNENFSNSLIRVQHQFIEFLNRPSKKMVFVNIYRGKYNAFVDKFAELKGNARVKGEFLDDLNELSEKLWEIIDLRKNEAINERKFIMTSGWIEGEMEKFYSYVQKIFVLETEKFLTSMTIIREFYNAMDNKSNSIETQIGKLINAREILNNLDMLNLEEGGKCPRLERLYRNCFRLIFLYEDKFKQIGAVMKVNAGPGEVPFTKRLSSRPLYMKKNLDSTFSDDRREIFLFDEEMRNSLRTEKMKYKYRISALKNWAHSILLKLRHTTNDVYNLLDNWIIASVKAQNEASNNLMDKLAGLIEWEKRVNLDCELDSFNIYKVLDVNGVMNSKLEVNQDMTRFDLNNFKDIAEDMRTYAANAGLIRYQVFNQVYFKKHLIDLNSKGIPDSIKALSYHNYNRMMRDLSNDEWIDWRQVLTLLALLHCKVIPQSDEDQLKKEVQDVLFKSVYITKEQYMKLSFWYESDPCIPTYEDEEVNISLGETVSKLKEVIFDLNKNAQEYVNFPELLATFSLENFPKIQKDKVRTYFDLIYNE